MSSRVRLSNKEWISGLERTVSGILITRLKYFKRQMLFVVFFGRCGCLCVYDASGLSYKV